MRTKYVKRVNVYGEKTLLATFMLTSIVYCFFVREFA